jgi:hypothetical protein
MPKHSRKRRRNKTRSQRGGNLGGNPPSAWGYTLGTLGNGWTQFMNSLSVQPGSVNQGNQIVPVNGGTNSTQSQSGGKRRKCKRGKRGGNMLAVAEQAAVPLALFAMNNTLGSRRNRGKHSRRRR